MSGATPISTPRLLPRPGLQYAVEEGPEDNERPVYRCTLCKIMTDTKNKMVHFCSINHRYNVLVTNGHTPISLENSCCLLFSDSGKRWAFAFML